MHPKRTIVTEVERQILDEGEGYMHCSLQQGKMWQNSTHTSTLENVLGTTKKHFGSSGFHRELCPCALSKFQLVEAGSFSVSMSTNSSTGLKELAH